MLPLTGFIASLQGERTNSTILIDKSIAYKGQLENITQKHEESLKSENIQYTIEKQKRKKLINRLIELKKEYKELENIRDNRKLNQIENKKKQKIQIELENIRQGNYYL